MCGRAGAGIRAKIPCHNSRFPAIFDILDRQSASALHYTLEHFMRVVRFKDVC
jgi:hypothetical protein